MGASLCISLTVRCRWAIAIIFLSHQKMLHAPLLDSRFFCAPAAGYRPSVNKEKEMVCPLAE
jgi:hypothetical protein